MIKSVQSLRGIFALLIFVHHYTINKVPMIDAGNVAVVFFIMLSGAMLPLGYNDRIESPAFSFRRFIRKRLARLYPVYFLTLLGAVILLPVNHQPGILLPLICDTLMIQGWIPDPRFYFSGNPPGWCMADFFFFYLLFPVAYRFIVRHTAIALSSIITLLGLYFALTPLLPEKWIEPLTYISPLLRALDFILGIFLGYIIIQAPVMKKNSFLKASALETLTIILLSLFYIFQNIATPLYNNASWWWIPVFLLIWVFASTPFGEGCWSRFLSSLILVKFGAASYSFFLTGYLTIIATKLTIIHFTNDPAIINCKAAMLIALIPAIPIGWLTYRYIELPAAKFLRRK